MDKDLSSALRRRNKVKVKRKVLLFTWSVLLALFSISAATSTTHSSSLHTEGANFTFFSPTSTTPSSLDINSNCTPPSIDDFPRDLFSQDERRHGWIAVHFLVSLYLFYSLALVCDEYFVPSIERICEEMQLPSDVAGATFMAVATSSPELFTNVIGTFVTRGDLGVGTIVGSAVFNILAVAGICGISAKTALPLEWYPLTRDCLFYSVSVILLILVLGNRRVYWYEAIVLVVAYLVYILVMYNNKSLRQKAENLVTRLTSKAHHSSHSFTKNKGKRSSRRSSFVAELTSSTEVTPLLGDHHHHDQGLLSSLENSLERVEESEDGDISAEAMDQLLIAKAIHELEEQEKEEWLLFSVPKGASLFTLLQWGVTWPARACLKGTVPDCRDETWRPWYGLTLLMCVIWIALLSYVVSWMMTIIGHTLGIPDSVMGLTFIAAGTSVPEAVSSYIVAKQGLGTMSVSNSIGSNTFDILICLGLPWLIRSAIIANSEDVNYIQIHSGGLEYSAMILMASLILLYGTLALNGFYLDKKVGVVALLMYSAFLVFASLLEMNVFVTLNLPTCLIFD